MVLVCFLDTQFLTHVYGQSSFEVPVYTDFLLVENLKLIYCTHDSSEGNVMFAYRT